MKKRRRDAVVARRDWTLGGDQELSGGEGMRTPTMPAAMRLVQMQNQGGPGSTMTSQPQAQTNQQNSGVQHQHPGFDVHHRTINTNQQQDPSLQLTPTPTPGPTRAMSIGQEIYRLETELGQMRYIHGEYGRMFQNVEDNIEQMWEEVAQPDGGWSDEEE